MTDPIDFVVSLIGRDRAWRLGRGLYMRARGEKSANAIADNGEARLVERVLASRKPGERPAVLLDVGANLGEWSETALALAQRLACAVEIHVFEPTPPAAARLETLFSCAAAVAVHRLALSDRTGSARFAVFGRTAGTNSLELESAEAEPEQTIEVRVSTGEDFARSHGIDTLALVKIDTEGHDFSVLAGFEPLLARNAIGAAQFEYNSRWLAAHRSLRDVFALAERTGYRVGRVIPAGIELIDRWNPECDRFFEDNFALVRPDLTDALGGVAMRWSASNTLVPANS